MLLLFFLAFIVCANAFTLGPSRMNVRLNTRTYAEVEIIFPNNKKIKAASGSSLKDACSKAGFSPNYGCEEGKWYEI